MQPANRLNYGLHVAHLCSCLSLDQTGICRALRFIGNICQQKKERPKISELVEPSILSILTYFNKLLQNDSVSLTDKKRVRTREGAREHTHVACSSFSLENKILLSFRNLRL